MAALPVTRRVPCRSQAMAALLALGACQTAPPADPAKVLHCDNGETVEVGYAGDLAIVTYKNRTHRLRSVLSGSGARYEGDGLEWLTKGTGEGVITPLRQSPDGPAPAGSACKAGPPPP